MMATIRARLFGLVGVAMLPAIAILAYDEYLFRQQVFRKIQEDAYRVVALVGQQIQAEISETGRRCRLLERLPEIRAMDGSSSAVLAKILRESPQYTNVAIADATGRVVSSALPFTGEVSVRDTAARVGSDSTWPAGTNKSSLTPLASVAPPIVDWEEAKVTRNGGLHAERIQPAQVRKSGESESTTGHRRDHGSAVTRSVSASGAVQRHTT